MNQLGQPPPQNPALPVAMPAAQVAVPAPAPRKSAKPPELLELALPYLWLAGLILAFAAFVLWYRRRTLLARDTVSANELLTDAREWEEEGELSEEEFKKLRANLAPRLREPDGGPKKTGDPAKRQPPKNP